MRRRLLQKDLPQAAIRHPLLLRYVVLSSLVTHIVSEQAAASPPSTSADGRVLQESAQQLNFVAAASAFLPSGQCWRALLNMLEDENWKYMNDTASRWCRIRVENKMSTCCSNAEFAKGTADSCSDCTVDCTHNKMRDFCNAHIGGKACTLERKPFQVNSKNNITFTVLETFCVPSECDNSADLGDNLLIDFYDVQFKYLRVVDTMPQADREQHWLWDYSVAELTCPTITWIIVLVLVASAIFVPLAGALGYFLFVAKKERGRVLQSAEEDEDQQEDTQVEPLAEGTMGS